MKNRRLNSFVMEKNFPYKANARSGPFILNLSLSYIKDKFDVGLFYNAEGEKLSIVGILEGQIFILLLFIALI